ncbi:MAG: flagellar biosynthetic protein FliO [Burkholderiaceae bacterium]|jgi:flagellar biosynthetic protein FliO|nr:flagellar biosynthetic protein FliO [Burkholderiaceae bacterium]
MNQAASLPASVAAPPSLPASSGTFTAVQEPVAVAAGTAEAKLWSSFAATLLALVFVLALAWLLLRLFKRVVMPRAASGQLPLEVVQAVALGGRERLVVARQGDQEYVLGVTAASVNLIDKRVLKADALSSADDSKD